MNAIFWCTEVAEMVSQQMHPFYSIGLKMMFGCLLEHLENLRGVKRCKTCVSGMNALFWWTEVAKMVSHQMHAFYSIGPRMMFGCLIEHLDNLRHVKRWKPCVSGMNAIFWCTEVAEMVSNQMHPFYSIGPNVMFGCLLEHLINLRYVKRCKTCVSRMNALFWCTEVAKMVSHQLHAFYSIGPKVMFGCLLEHLENLWHVKRCKTRVSRLNAIFWCTEVAKNSSAPSASILLHWNENDVWLSFRTFRKSLACKNMQNL
jgi:ribosomal protein L31